MFGSSPDRSGRVDVPRAGVIVAVAGASCFCGSVCWVSVVLVPSVVFLPLRGGGGAVKASMVSCSCFKSWGTVEARSSKRVRGELKSSPSITALYWFANPSSWRMWESNAPASKEFGYFVSRKTFLARSIIGHKLFTWRSYFSFTPARASSRSCAYSISSCWSSALSICSWRRSTILETFPLSFAALAVNVVGCNVLRRCNSMAAALRKAFAIVVSLAKFSTCLSVMLRKKAEVFSPYSASSNVGGCSPSRTVVSLASCLVETSPLPTDASSVPATLVGTDSLTTLGLPPPVVVSGLVASGAPLGFAFVRTLSTSERRPRYASSSMFTDPTVAGSSMMFTNCLAPRTVLKSNPKSDCPRLVRAGMLRSARVSSVTGCVMRVLEVNNPDLVSAASANVDPAARAASISSCALRAFSVSSCALVICSCISA